MGTRRWPVRGRRRGGGLWPYAVLALAAMLLVGWLSHRPRSEYTQYVAHAAAAHRVPRALIEAVIQEESGGNPWAVSPVGAVGLMQVTADKFRPGQDPFSPQVNIDVGTRYLANMLRQFHGDVRLALAAYNAGPNAVLRHHGVPPYPQTIAYVDAVLRAYHRLTPTGRSDLGSP